MSPGRRRTDRAGAAGLRPGPAASRRSGDALGALVAIDRLEVGAVKMEPRRLTAPYTVVRGRTKATTDLIYRYDESVFQPGNPTSQNLANMIGAQIALNYGLFCREIVFRGAFGTADKGFLRDMMENTSREIYVKKLLEPNPFLKGPAKNVPIIRKKTYTRARISFPDSPADANIPWNTSATNRNSFGILSSGGKDSLLSYGLLNELGCETHPVFGNESGRHWFTALNAFRHFEKNIPNTARVWMNSDRVFAWMLRHLPFIRRDFASQRADEYPIRLWTVALFLFGALPILYKRGVGRVIIGDEFDTTTRLSHGGIPHYGGLFDQSRYFDNVMSRYFNRKQWGASQFSILRTLSEFLIEKILVERYPHLFEHQVSCHAAHVESGRVHPCGRCEKCRRIVAMLVANGADPCQCGYTREQVPRCLQAVAKLGLHQERPGTQQLMWMLSEKGAIDPPAGQKKNIRPRPEVLKLRIDQEKSPLGSMPVDLRKPLFRIFLEHADGAVRRVGRTWLDVDILRHPSINRPYAFERSAVGMGKSKISTASVDGYILGELSWPEAKKRLKEVDIALLPVGAIEQHGPHLPLDTDAFDAEYLAKQVASRCSDPKPIVLPLVPYGVSYHHDDFPGTISITNETLARLVYEIGLSVSRNGITKLVMINGHGGNGPSLNFAAQRLNRDAHMFICVDTGETSDVDIEAMVKTQNDVHAGEIETSTTLANRPHLVKMDKAEKLIPKFSSRYLSFTSKRAVPWYAFTKKISENGVMGDPTQATAEKGREMWRIMIENLVEFVEEIKKMTLDEIFQKRY
jgi:creatinine amidohydrolase/Fe(II)-dependent formamide hydrolase-like protein